MEFLELARKVLIENNRPMTASEVWDYAVSKAYDQKLVTKGKTPKATLGARMYTAANDPGNNNFRTIGERPKRFYLPDITPASTLVINESQPADSEEAPKVSKYKEKDLHQVLAYHVRNHLGAFPKTISHSKSNKKEYGEWVHPDMVACYFPQDH
ncbi:MAG: HTH domain-containing protein [Imperialibacter sp.]|uniref:HTH domain-containing protein n=1 Tax=Imperialibacter sp. TaxID=2038411 RepID=UPI0032EB5E89